jgi:soluble lytic murein transglycosylase
LSRIDRKQAGFFLLTALFLFVYWLAVRHVHAHQGGDTTAFEEVARSQLAWTDIFSTQRPPIYPLMFLITGFSRPAVAAIQFFAYAASWIFLAAVLWRRTLWIAALVFYVALFPEFAGWNHVLMSESLACSFTVAAFSFFILWLDGKRWALWPFAAVMILKCYLRDFDAFLCVFYIPIILLLAYFRRATWLAAGAISTLFLANFVFVSHTADDPHTARWLFAMFDNLGTRILPDPKFLAWCQAHGMPVNDALRTMTGHTAAQLDWKFFKDPTLADLRTWIFAHGRSVYTSYLLQHPWQILSRPWHERDAVFQPFFPPLMHYYFDPAYNLAMPPWPPFLVIYLTGTLAACVFAWRLIARGLSDPATPHMAAAILLWLMVIPIGLAVYHADSLEMLRHAVPVLLQAALAFLLMARIAAGFRNAAAPTGNLPRISVALACLLPIILAPLHAHAQPIANAIAARDWPRADALAEQEPDPVSRTLVQFLRLLQPGQGTAREIGAFMQSHPDWPYASVLHRRLDEAIAAQPDDTEALQDCETFAPRSDRALARCADAARNTGDAAKAQKFARAAWVAGMAASQQAENAFLARNGADIDPATQRRRFEALIGNNNQAAERQASRLGPDDQALAHARLAFQRNDPAAPGYLSSVPATQKTDPGLFLDQARWLRIQNREPEEVTLWQTAGLAAERAAPAARRAAFWSERERLARDRLDANDAAGAYTLADDPAATGDQAPDALFLAGWIALRRLNDADRARQKFQALADFSPSAITQGRAWYWLGRASPIPAAQQAAWRHAALYPFTFYGQLACKALSGPGEAIARIRAWPDPTYPPEEALALAGDPLVRAATILKGWGDAAHTRGFLLAAANAAPAKGYAQILRLQMLARLSSYLAIPDTGVAAARLAGRLGYVLPHAGWPAPYHPPGADPAIALAIMRQESSFDPNIASGAGAVGLMQLMPATARGMGGGRLTDPDDNMRLGTTYFETLLLSFAGNKVFAIAAYNAGSRHVHDWIAEHGDPGSDAGSDAMLDWIELIPFAETRNYVQRVLESETIYQALAP